jgi:hypothetical protein
LLGERSSPDLQDLEEEVEIAVMKNFFLFPVGNPPSPNGKTPEGRVERYSEHIVKRGKRSSPYLSIYQVGMIFKAGNNQFVDTAWHGAPQS